ncbi:Prolyl-tRNA synthetase associated domain-containing protein [Balamuthia mandrillaris]
MAEEEDHKRRQALFEFLRTKVGITDAEGRTVSHPPVHTVEAWRPHVEELGLAATSIICKNLFLKDKKGTIVLVFAHADTAVNLGTLGKHLKLRNPRFAGEDLLQEVLQVKQGSVTPLALYNDREAHKVGIVVVDSVLYDDDGNEEKSLLVHPLTNDHTTMIRSGELKRFIAACGHQEQVVDFAASVLWKEEEEVEEESAKSHRQTWFQTQLLKSLLLIFCFRIWNHFAGSRWEDAFARIQEIRKEAELLYQEDSEEDEEDDDGCTAGTDLILLDAEEHGDCH